MGNKKILYKFPTRERPKKAFAAIDNIMSLSRHSNYEILLTLDIDDVTMRGEEIKSKITSYGGKVRAIWGTSEGKIHACNRDLEFAGDFDIICLHSDDMLFIKEGFDLDILDAFLDFSGLAHFPDQEVNERLCTYTIMDKNYFSIFNYLYSPEYFSVYSDMELQDVAKMMNRYKYVNKNILHHKHPIWGHGVKDSLLERTENPANYAKDHETYIRRKLKNFNL